MKEVFIGRLSDKGKEGTWIEGRESKDSAINVQREVRGEYTKKQNFENLKISQ